MDLFFSTFQSIGLKIISIFEYNRNLNLLFTHKSKIMIITTKQHFIFLFIILLIPYTAFSQDTITKKSGENIQAKIELITGSEIRYKIFTNPNGPSYTIDKSELSQIKLENGEVEIFEITSVNNKISKEETKEFIVKTINEHGFEEDTFNRRYKATFEGDFLRLIVLRRNGQESNGGLLYDFSNVYKFQRVSKRSDKLSFINIYVAISENKKNTRWDKHKLIMRVDNYQIAESIVNALKHYNSFFVNNEKSNSKF